jgi:hypothetical protein
MVSFLNTRRPGRPPKHSALTAVTFSTQDLVELGHLIAVGQAVLQKRVPVVARLKAAMTRLGVRIPQGL